jgi:hypothetical protein
MSPIPAGTVRETIPSSSRCHDRKIFSTTSGPDAAISGGNTGEIEVAAMGAPIPAFVGGISAMNRALHWGVARLIRWRISSMRPSGGRSSAKVFAVAKVLTGSIKGPLIEEILHPDTSVKHPESRLLRSGTIGSATFVESMTE